MMMRDRKMLTTDTYEIMRTTNYVKSVNGSCVLNPDAMLDDEDLEDHEGEVIPLYVNQPMEAKIEYDGKVYKVFARPQSTRLPWEEIGIVQPSPFLAESIRRMVSSCVAFAGGSVIHIYRSRIEKKFIPFTFTYQITYEV